MKKILFALLVVGVVTCWAAVPSAQAQQITVRDGAMPASGVNVLMLELLGKIGSGSTGTTDNNGVPSNTQAILNSGATSTRARYCRDDKTLELIPSGQKRNNRPCAGGWLDIPGTYSPGHGPATIQVGPGARIYQAGGGGGLGAGSSIVINPNIGGRFGFNSYPDTKNFCNSFDTEYTGYSPSCSVGSTSFKGYVDGAIDFLSRNWYPGFGAGLVVDGEFSRSTNVKTSNEGVTSEEGTYIETYNESVWGWKQLGVGFNAYFPIPGTGDRLVVGPTIRRNFWTENYNTMEKYVSGTSTSSYNSSYVYTGQATEYGGFARYRFWKGLSAEFAASYENIANEGLTSGSSVNLWDYGFGMRYDFNRPGY